MTLEVRPYGVKCNLKCQYCYQNPQRDAGNSQQSIDLQAMENTFEKMNTPLSLFGGEALLVPIDILERMFSWSYERFGKAGIQTNGTLVSDEHIRLFKKYNVSVGVSIDGPGSLNDLRWVGSEKKTRAYTQKTENNILRLCQKGVRPGLIVTLHRGNSTPDKLPVMKQWFEYLDELGVVSTRLHILEIEEPVIRERYALSEQENIDAFIYFYHLHKHFKQLKIDVFKEIEGLLSGNDQTVGCVWQACDPYSTPAVQGVEGDGTLSNCGRMDKEGIGFVKADDVSFERYIGLQRTPQNKGGCAGCRFFIFCKGQCPGTALNGDWRNKSEYCAVWKNLFTKIETDLEDTNIQPLSKHPRRQQVEEETVFFWGLGINRLISSEFANLTEPAANIESGSNEVQFKLNLDISPQSKVKRDSLYTFNRVCWVNDEAREIWASRFEKLQIYLKTIKPHADLAHCCTQQGNSSIEQMLVNSMTNGDVYSTSNPAAINALLSVVGLAYPVGFPCSLDCEASTKNLQHFLTQEADNELILWLKEMFRWPIKWSSVNRNGELLTPVCKMAFNSQLNSDVFIHYQGESYPAEGVAGINFPYRLSNRTKILDDKALLFDDWATTPPIESFKFTEINAQQIKQENDVRIDWTRLAEPQDDAYDSTILRQLLKSTPYICLAPKIYHKQDKPRHDGDIILAHIHKQCPLEPFLKNDDLTINNIKRATQHLSAWPVLARQFKEFVTVINPVKPGKISPSSSATSYSHCYETEFGAIYVSIEHPIQLAQAFVHELAHMKLFAMGIAKTQHCRLLLNSPNELYISPIIRDRHRPMSAVLHAQYAFIHVMAFDLELYRLYRNDQTKDGENDFILNELARNLVRMQEGRDELLNNIELDKQGEQFFAGFCAWSDRILTETELLLKENHIAIPSKPVVPAILQQENPHTKQRSYSVHAFIENQHLTSSIAILGPEGAGKTTLSKCWSEQLNLPVVSIDTHCWRYYLNDRHFKNALEIIEHLFPKEHVTQLNSIELRRALLEQMRIQLGANFKDHYELVRLNTIIEILNTLEQPHIIDFGEGHGCFHRIQHQQKLQQLLSEFQNTIILLPSNNTQRTMKTLLERAIHRNSRTNNSALLESVRYYQQLQLSPCMMGNTRLQYLYWCDAEPPQCVEVLNISDTA